MSGTKSIAAPVSGRPDAPQRPCADCPWAPASDLVDLFPDMSDLEEQLAAIDLDLDELLGPDLDLDSLFGGGGDPGL